MFLVFGGEGHEDEREEEEWRRIDGGEAGEAEGDVGVVELGEEDTGVDAHGDHSWKTEKQISGGHALAAGKGEAKKMKRPTRPHLYIPIPAPEPQDGQGPDPKPRSHVDKY